jgi:hypothetical protein
MELNQRIALSCDRPNFTECDRCVVNFLRPHLMQAEENSPESIEIQQILPLFKQSLDQGGVISLAIGGQVQFITSLSTPLVQVSDFATQGEWQCALLVLTFTHRASRTVIDYPSHSRSD